ncbi:uncharacterized protein EV154DRAFT_425433, partial [Mucor mucedo]|uniref:uncharacterized protein n=1 Tax=Mucor mucedo TaxID=29922 RepID=UPI00221EB6A2
LWMKQLDSVAPDFTELLKSIQDIIKFNKSFYETEDIEIPYNRYFENFINNVNQRQDILCIPSIQQLLDVTIKLDSFHTQVDCSNVVDILTQERVVNYKLQPLGKILLCDTFNCNELSKRVRLILTVNDLYFCSVENEKTDSKYTLLYKPVSTKHISIRTIHTDRELIGEYNVQFWIQKQKLFTMKASTKEDRNMWLGLETNSSTKDQAFLAWEPLNDIVAKYDLRRQSSKSSNSPKSIRTQDIFTFYTDQTGEISPLQQPPLPSNSPYLQQQQNLSVSSPNLATKKPSFMRSVIAAVSSPRSSFPANGAEPPVQPQHLGIPPPQSPFGPRSSFINNHSTPSFISSANSSSQSSLALTPPLSRSSSPGSMTPVIVNRYATPSSSSSEDLGSPPDSPDILTQANSIKNVLYTNNETKVFHWKDESWYAVEEDCLLEVRQTFSNRSCIAIHLKNSGQFYLNAWILPDTFIIRTSDTDLSLSLHITNDQSELENYLFHCQSKSEADELSSLLEQMHQESIQMNLVISANKLAKTFKLAMQCKCKLYVQSASSKWNSFGSVYMKVSQQYATKKMHIAMESHKGGKTTQLVSAMVQSRNVERLGPKRITFLMVDELEKNSVVYMIQVREELTGDKIFEYVKTKNSENGW